MRISVVKNPIFEIEGVRYKFCTECELDLPLTEFRRMHTFSNVYRTQCKKCIDIKVKARLLAQKIERKRIKQEKKKKLLDISLR